MIGRAIAQCARLISGARFHSVTVVPGSRLAVATEKAGTAIVFDPSTGNGGLEIWVPIRS